MTEHNNPQDNVTVPRELLRQILDACAEGRDVYADSCSTAAYDALRLALDAPAVEPVASVTVSNYKGLGNRDLDYWGELPDGTHMLYTAPQAQPAVEPVTDEENERFSQDVSNFSGADPEATKHALEAFLRRRDSWQAVCRLSQRFENHADQYAFYPAGHPPYLDNVDECVKVYTAPQAQQPAPVQEPDVDYRSMYLKVRDELAEAQQRLDTCEALARSVMIDQVGRA